MVSPRACLAVALIGGGIVAASCAPIGEYDQLPTEAVCRTHFAGLQRAQRPELRHTRPQGHPTPPTAPVHPPGAVFRVVDPSGPASFTRESVHAIAWIPGPTPPGATVRVEESADGGASWSPVGSADASAGRVLWTIPADGAARRRLRIAPSWAEAPPHVVDVDLRPSEKRDYQWVCVTDTTPLPAGRGAGALVYHDRMWLLGGAGPTDYFPRGATGNDVWSSSDGRAWRQEKAQSFKEGEFDTVGDWEGRHSAGYAVFADKMWIVGGDAEQHHYQPDVWSSSDGRSWTRATQRAPWGERTLHHTLVFLDRMWILGGQTTTDLVPDGAPYRVFNDVWSSNDGATWVEVPAKGEVWQPRSAIMQGAVHGGRMWVVGGGADENLSAGFDHPQRMSDVWSSPNGAEWTREAETTPFTPRSHQSVVAWDDRLWVIGGYSDEGSADGGWYSATGRDWYPTRTPWEPRGAASVWVFRDAIWMTGGGATDVWRLERAK